MVPDPFPDPTSRVQALFADFLARTEAGERPDFDALCRDHSKDASDLRCLRDDWERVQVALNVARDRGGSFAARLKQKYGEGVDPEVSLEAGPAETPGTATDELVRRLSQHAPTTSRYKLEGEVARGGMGAILKVWDEDLRRHLAMKVVLGKGEPMSTGVTPPVDQKQLARFLEEAQVTGQLDHPGIVPVHELGLDSDGRVYFTMKLVKGRDLKRIFDLVFEGKEGWNETRALGVILKGCEAMAYAHAKGVIHRDLKPANVMVGSFGEVFVMDWGLARVLGKKDTHDIRLQPEFTSALTSVKSQRRDDREDLSDSPIVTMDGDVMGTPAYMGPEQARGEVEKLGPRSDVYSMGAMLYHLLARHAPYLTPGMRVSNHTVLAMVLQGPPAALTSRRRDVPVELVAICEKAMARDARDRYADTLALAEDLRAFLEHRVVGAFETGAWAEARKWVQRNKPLAAALAGAVVILVGGAVTSMVFAKKADDRASDLATANDRLSRKTAEAEAKMNEVLSLSAIQELKELVTRADDLWPAFPAEVAEYDRWLADARVLIEGRAADPVRGVAAHPSLKDHEAKLAEIRQRVQQLPPEQMQGDRGPLELNDARDRWWHAQLLQLVDDLNAFTDAKTGLFSEGTSEHHGWGIVKRRMEAATIEDRSVSGAEPRRRWNEAIAAIASSPRYGGLKLTAQLGLLPIGEDPDSRLWEFAHLQTGEPAQRGPEGKLVLKEDMGLVFVLIPAGTFWMGAQKTDPRGHNYDPKALEGESPVHAVTLDAYFLSKYEMTQGQWERFTGKNPSNYNRENYIKKWSRAGKAWSTLHPVEQMSWLECEQTLRRLGLILPSEAQWERGARADTLSVWWTGDEVTSLRDAANVADCYGETHDGGWAVWEKDLDDGNTIHAEIGSFRANAFGLHDVMGNVLEWCRDGLAGYDSPVRVGDGERRTENASFRMSRGGSYYDVAAYARSACRSDAPPGSRDGALGLRPALAITP